jgi:hypothetical protein
MTKITRTASSEGPLLHCPVYVHAAQTDEHGVARPGSLALASLAIALSLFAASRVA